MKLSVISGVVSVYALIEPDITQDFALQVRQGGEDAAVDNIALEFTEPDLDLIEPTEQAKVATLSGSTRERTVPNVRQ